jgi:hypothetical protein
MHGSCLGAAEPRPLAEPQQDKGPYRAGAHESDSCSRQSGLLLPGMAFRNRPVDLRLRRFLQSPYREILRNRRPRHTPGTRHTRCRRAGKRSGPWGVCRRLPSFCVSGAPAAIPKLRFPLRMNSGASAPGWLFPLESAGFRVGSLGNGYRCSFRQIVAVFCPIANRFFDESPEMAAGTDLLVAGKPRLEGDFKRTYTKYGPNKSHISC